MLMLERHLSHYWTTPLNVDTILIPEFLLIIIIKLWRKITIVFKVWVKAEITNFCQPLIMSSSTIIFHFISFHFIYLNLFQNYHSVIIVIRCIIYHLNREIVANCEVLFHVQIVWLTLILITSYNFQKTTFKKPTYPMQCLHHPYGYSTPPPPPPSQAHCVSTRQKVYIGNYCYGTWVYYPCRTNIVCNDLVSFDYWRACMLADAH